MYTVLIFADGRQVDALLLSATPDRLRVAIPGRGDAVEFRMANGRWTSSRGVSVEIGALVVDYRMSAASFLPQADVRTLCAV